MRFKLSVVVGIQRGREFTFDGHDIFLAGRSHRCHFQVDDRDKAFSRIHFLIEINPPCCRLIDLGSRNGTMVNGRKVLQADLRNGDQIQVGPTALRVAQLADPTIGAHAETDEPLSGVLFRSPLSASKQGLEKSAAPGLPKQVAGYRILRLLGQGVAGVTCAALREVDNATMAVKIIDPPMTGARLVIDKFLHDLQELRQLDDSRLLPIIDHGESMRQIYIVSEFVPGMDSEKFLAQRTPLRIGFAVQMMLPVLAALENLHAKGVVHGAIKPTNILVEEQGGKGRIRLSDYGVTRLYEASPLSGLTLTMEMRDALHYLPPERLHHFRDVTPASDQYAVAATLYHLLTGAHLYQFDSPAQGLLRILNEEPAPVRLHRDDVFDDLAMVLHRALAREPRDRFGSITEFREALEPFARAKEPVAHAH